MYFRRSTSAVLSKRVEIELIEVKHLSVKLGGRLVLSSINVEFRPGLHTILGRNGSGKSTLLRTIAGLVKPSGGKVLVLGRDIHRVPRKEAVKLVGYTWQNPYAGFIETTVRDELEFSSKVVGTTLDREVVEILVPGELMDRNPFTLSGGEAKRVSMASILALDQPVWLLDEPFEQLDSEGVESVIRVINYGLQKGKTVVVASANLAYFHALRVSQVVILHRGEIALRGSVNDLNSTLLRGLGIPPRDLLCG